MANARVTSPTTMPVTNSVTDATLHRPTYNDTPEPQLETGELSSGDDSGAEESGDSDEATELVGVSIGRTQSRLVNSRTPAVEKAAALQDGGDYFAPLEDLTESPDITPNTSPDVGARDQAQGSLAAKAQENGVADNQLDEKFGASKNQPHEQQALSSVALPSPWIAGPKKFRFEDEQHARSRSGSDLSRVQLPFGLTSIRKPMEIWNSFRGAEGSSRPRSVTIAHRRSNRWSGQFFSSETNQPNTPAGSAQSSTNSNGFLQGRGSESTLVPYGSPANPDLGQQTGQVCASPRITRRRSEESFSLHRAASTASSLGDDTRFENISEMVNSRMKAIKDSIGDARIPRPSLPTIPKLESLKLLHARTGLDERSRGSSSDSGLFRRKTDLTSAQDSTRAIESFNERIPGPSVSRLKPASASTSIAEATLYPRFTRAFSKLTGDLVILGGYRGSVLREAQEPHRRLWITTKAGLNVRKVNLEVGLEDEDEERMPEKIYASGMLTHIGPVDISARLFKRLRSCENVVNGSLRIHEYAYDWRLSPHRLSRQLLAFIEKLPSNQPGTAEADRGAFMIAHSLGGLITRHAVNQRPELFSGVVFAGSPHRCINILGPIRNGDNVLLSSKVLTAQVNFTIRTSFALLPLDGFCFIDKETKEEYPVDFFDVNQWIEYRWSPCVGPVLPALAPQKTGLGSMIATASAALPTIPSLPDLSFLSKRKADTGTSTAKDAQQRAATATKSATAAVKGGGGMANTSMAPQMHESPPLIADAGDSVESTTDDSITISREAAIKYLTRTLSEVKQFKLELTHKPEFTEKNIYPPLGVIYGKSEPTVYAARVSGREGIKRADAYDNLAFASGDGVVLARSAMLPDGYRAVKGGVVATEKGHVSLLSDLEAVGRAVEAVAYARRKLGVGTGASQDAAKETMT